MSWWSDAVILMRSAKQPEDLLLPAGSSGRAPTIFEREWGEFCEWARIVPSPEKVDHLKRKLLLELPLGMLQSASRTAVLEGFVSARVDDISRSARSDSQQLIRSIRVQTCW